MTSVCASWLRRKPCSIERPELHSGIAVSSGHSRKEVSGFAKVTGMDLDGNSSISVHVHTKEMERQSFREADHFARGKD